MTHKKALHRFAVFTAIGTFCLIVAGGLVTSTQSGLAVPDWPLSYGELMPPMVGGIFYEHTHRMVATFVGLLTIVLAFWLWRKEERRWMRILGFVALGLVMMQGLLGGLTVLLLLPTAVSVTHATIAQTFFALISAIALFTSRWWREKQSQPMVGTKSPSVVWLPSLTTVAVFIQLILGALMRHTDSGLAVPDFPLAYGQLFPSLSPEALTNYNQLLIQSDNRLAADGPITAAQIVIHMLHRGWAIVVSIMILSTSLRLARLSAITNRLSRFSLLLVLLLLVQLGLGALTVLSVKQVGITTAHVAAGALMLITCMLASLHVIKLFGVPLRKPEIVLAAREVPA